MNKLLPLKSDCLLPLELQRWVQTVCTHLCSSRSEERKKFILKVLWSFLLEYSELSKIHPESRPCFSKKSNELLSGIWIVSAVIHSKSRTFFPTKKQTTQAITCIWETWGRGFEFGLWGYQGLHRHANRMSAQKRAHYFWCQVQKPIYIITSPKKHFSYVKLVLPQTSISFWTEKVLVLSVWG